MALSAAKAKKILKDGKVRGKALTKKQRGLMGLVASGKRKMNAKNNRAIRYA